MLAEGALSGRLCKRLWKFEKRALQLIPHPLRKYASYNVVFAVAEERHAHLNRISQMRLVIYAVKLLGSYSNLRE